MDRVECAELAAMLETLAEFLERGAADWVRKSRWRSWQKVVAEPYARILRHAARLLEELCEAQLG